MVNTARSSPSRSAADVEPRAGLPLDLDADPHLLRNELRTPRETWMMTPQNFYMVSECKCKSYTAHYTRSRLPGISSAPNPHPSFSPTHPQPQNTHKKLATQLVAHSPFGPCLSKDNFETYVLATSQLPSSDAYSKPGPKMVERRLKTVRRLFHPLPVEMCAMLISDDAYFSFFHFTNIFLTARSAENVLV